MKVLLVGIITTALVLLGLGFCMATRQVVREEGRAIVVLDRGHGIREGTSVTYLGVQFGVIDRVALHDGRVVAELRIEERGATLRKGDGIAVQSLGIFGDKVLDVVPGPRTAPILGAADTLFTVQPPEVSPEDLLEAWSRGVRGGATRPDTSPR
jgi:ABC-type transporter Mla subunit MlaD